jgi:hypothetical protein
MGDLPCTLYMGCSFDENASVIVPYDQSHVPALWEYTKSPEFRSELRKIDQSIKITCRTLVKVPFDVRHWSRMAEQNNPHGLAKPYSNEPTQWLFDGHPRGSANPNALDSNGHPTRPAMAEHPLQVAVARLLGYRWPRQSGSAFLDCPAVHEPDEIDTSGLVDDESVACLPALHGEPGAAARLRTLLAHVWAAGWSEGTLRSLLAAEDAKAGDLDGWLTNEFFEAHCNLFHQTPFIFHIWDGVRGGFSALVNYHKLCAPDGGGRRTLEKIRDTYLGEWLARQRRALDAGEAGAEEKLLAADHLRGELTNIIQGEPPYDIFVRWKPVHRQPIGWEPDIDDGVRLNLRPFIVAKTRNAAAKGCILRCRPNLRYGKDRGGEPPRERRDFPWLWAEDDDVGKGDYAGRNSFQGNRYNDFHYTRAFKLAARDRQAPGAAA